MHVTVCIPTRDLGAVIVDQSRGNHTVRAMRSASRDDPRFYYIKAASVGSSTVRNLAVAHARGPLLAFTDDDCDVAPEWLERMVAHFQRHPDVGLIYGAVYPSTHHSRVGFVPDYPLERTRRITSAWLKFREGGIGANMARRLETWRVVGPFDELLGPGSPFHAYLDGDITYRTLKASYTVLNVSDAVVTHHGFRTWRDGRQSTGRVGMSEGAA